MRYDDFINALRSAGCAGLDSKNIRIRALWRQLFPTVAALERELKEAQEAIDALRREAGEQARGNV